MRQRRGEGDQLPLGEHRHQHHRVVGVSHIAGVRVVKNDDVAVGEVIHLVIFAEMIGHRGKRAEMERQLFRYRYRAQPGVQQTGAAVFGFSQDGRVTAVKQHDAHLFDDARHFRMD